MPETTTPIQAGMVVHAQFPTDEGGALPHYCLVLQVITQVVGQTRVKLAYGTSKRVSPSHPLPGELILSEPDELATAGLCKPTRFNLNRLATLPACEITPVGTLVLSSRNLRRRLKSALIGAMAL